ncbi:MAG: aspartate aminotransferase family protein [Elusimicrobia bacterium]|nr:aspartate aminotransferase family protein [Elusimicrobiota bacterium]MDE2424358.1 aspartate aminotransferase family protein [Elusimicrobiota bacterium]
MTTSASPSQAVAGPKSLALFEEEQRYLAPGLQSIALFSRLAMDGGSGAVLRDMDGREYLDFVAGIGVASLGYGHPSYARALSEQAAKTAVGSFTTARRLSFVKTLSTVTPKGLDRIQLYSSGAEGVEAALRLAKSRTKKFEVVSFWGGFHGKTGGVLPLLADSFKFQLGPLLPGLYSSPYPDSRRCPLGADGEHDCGAHCLEFLREKLRRETTGALSAIILEPIQGTNGNVVPPPGFFAGAAQIAREAGALFISDEMITGFGRTGEWFGCVHEGVVPDIMTVGKGMAGGFPVSGVITSTEIAESKPWANPSGSSSSYGGNPLACAACDVTLRAIIEERLVENSRQVGAALLRRLREIGAACPLVGAVRGRGLMIGIDLVQPGTRQPLEKALCRELFEDCLRRGLLTMSYNPSLRINPPLVITEAQALRGADLLGEALAQLQRRRF